MWQAMFPAETERALADRALRPSPQPPARTSAWAQVGAIVAAPYTGFAQGVNETLRVANKAYSLMPGAGGAAMASLRDEQLRSGVEFWRPDAQSATWALSFLHEASRVVSKVVGYGLAGGPAGAVVGTSVDEGTTGYLSLRDRGVDRSTAAKVGAVKAATTAMSVAAPVAGRTVAQTAGIVLGAGPGAFVAEQALSRSILEQARYREIASEFDPFDPAGLALSLVPGAVVGAGVHAARARRAKSAASATTPGTSAAETPSSSAAPAAAMAEHAEAVEAAHVAYQREVIDAHQLAPADDPQARARHERALLEARAALDEGRPMQLGDLAVDPKRAADLQAEIVQRVRVADEARAAEAAAEQQVAPRARPEPMDPRTLPEVVRAFEVLEPVRHLGDNAVQEAAKNQPDPTVHNLVVGIHEAYGDEAKIARLLEQYQRRVLASPEQSFGVVADIVDEMRGDKPTTLAQRGPVERAMLVARAYPDMPVRLADDGSAASRPADVMTAERLAARAELAEAKLAYQAAIECILETEVG